MTGRVRNAGDDALTGTTLEIILPIEPRRQKEWLVRVPLRISCVAAAMLAAACSPAPPGASQPPGGAAAAPPYRALNLYDWADYIDPKVVAEFEKTTGIKVLYSTFESLEMMETKMLAGSSGFDVVDVAGVSVDRLAAAGVLRKLDRAQLANIGNLDPDLMKSEHAIGYQWGTTGIGYDARAVRKFAPDAPVDSWRLIYDPAVVAKLAGCGLSFNNSKFEMISTALIYIGADPNQPTPQQLEAAGRALGGIRPYVRRIDGPSQINDLASGAICLMVTASTNVAIARSRAREAGLDLELRYVIPKEGSISWFDMLAIPIDAPHPKEAYAFLDFLLRPDVAARNASYTGGATANRGALPMIDAAVRDDEMLYPPANIRARLHPFRDPPPERSRAESTLWSKFEFQSAR